MTFKEKIHTENPKGYAYIYTIGCQMNTYDTERLFFILGGLGYVKTNDLHRADIIVCNTCSIREKAQEKAFSFLGRVPPLKKAKPHLITIMTGCVAQQEAEEVFKRNACIDIVLGTQAFSRLGGHIMNVLNGRGQITDVEDSPAIYEAMPDFSFIDNDKVSRFVTIMQGCDNFCTYCVVPYVRGRERSRTPESIVEEISILADAGVKEVTLLGQNVNSYGQKEQICSFSDLLEQISRVSGIERIRFATSHPKDLSDDLIYAIRDIDKVCNQLHLPVQSGSNRILKKMNRGYTKEQYLERVGKLRKNCPSIALSSDMIIGFPSETRADFDETMDLVRRVEFDGIFAFAYSDRPQAPASKFSDGVEDAEKMERLNELIQFQDEMTHQKNQALVGAWEQVLVEGLSQKKRHDEGENPSDFPQMTGRTESGKIVHFYGNNVCPGEILDVKIKYAYPHSLWAVQGR
ncbi:MiaB [Desulforapulum autotrophicum HRM2]|uniref:tRNA-2-methylthio-N(6)-dimethylallyladenosine synthase n=1 Tax=Desulforapulum autotrophicum (strain ATCC 43914 / DSM 3382 / VKM B-1955 / HRM2) TaxID=177437 RepID=C0QDK5_DESAH|nr:tRNA (N6-isopentenyl adenosine(37)-C2)-methylthiotransferase MiaB [Desulforapulum autotrophicum]ACN15269.1 MiaB [Desulforapulum autotrophicum HRM2]